MNTPFRHKLPQRAASNSVWRERGVRTETAFTLIELLTVIAIIGILLTLGIPMIRGMNKSNVMIAADRQLLDDINYARQRAIGDHTSVYIVFMPPLINSSPFDPSQFPVYPGSDPTVSTITSNLYGGQLTTYALVSLRSIGDQPGRPTAHYLTSWRTLPGGVYIATNKFFDISAQGYAPPFFVDNRPEFPFPVATNTAQGRTDFPLPHFGFNYLGQMIYRSGNKDNLVYSMTGGTNHMYIPLVRGSLFYQRNPDNTYAAQVPDIAETQPGNAYYQYYNSTNAQGGAPLPNVSSTNNYNQIYVDPLTGRARVQRLQIQ